MSESPIPRRHGVDVATGRRVARPVRWLIRGRRSEPDPRQWERLGKALNAGDPSADALVTWMREAGMSTAMPLFRQALAQGLASVAAPPPPLRDFFAAVDTRPSWVDCDLLKAGARACQMTGLTGLRALRDLALMGGYQASAINRTLVLTGALNGGVQRRLAETTKWWIDCTGDGGMERGGAGFQTTLHVRVIHALIRSQVAARPEWDTAELGLPVNQADMHVTYLGFSVIFLFGSRLLGVPLSREDGRAVMHLWRYIGWLMGVDPQWLLDDEMDGRVALYHNLLAQAPPDQSSAQLGRALMDEPLQRHYRLLPKLQGRYQKALHLSIARTFLGAASMRALGLPSAVLPWFPALCTPTMLAWHSANRLTPGGRERLVWLGRRAQVNYLPTLFGDAAPDVRSITRTAAGGA